MLNNFKTNDILMIISKIAFLFILTCVLAVISNTVCRFYKMLIFPHDGGNDHNSLSPIRRAIILSINALVPLIIACFLTSAKPFLAIGGSIGSNCLCYPIPAESRIM